MHVWNYKVSNLTLLSSRHVCRAELDSRQIHPDNRDSTINISCQHTNIIINIIFVVTITISIKRLNILTDKLPVQNTNLFHDTEARMKPVKSRKNQNAGINNSYSLLVV